MDITRRGFGARLAAAGGLALTGAAGSLLRPGPALADAPVNEDGLHYQPWFLTQSFLVLEEDLADSAAEGKRFAVVFEQKGCPYCKEMHLVNFAKEQVTSYVKEHFNILQLNIWGSRIVTDFDGEELGERELARKWQVNFTPTIVFLPEDPAAASGKTGRDAEVARMPGYFKPFHFLSMFEYVNEKAYAEESFQRFLQHKFERLEAEGKKPDVW